VKYSPSSQGKKLPRIFATIAFLLFSQDPREFGQAVLPERQEDLRVLQSSKNGITRAGGRPRKLRGRYRPHWRLNAQESVQPARQFEPTRASLSGEVISAVRAGVNQPSNRCSEVRRVGRRAVLIAHHTHLRLGRQGAHRLGEIAAGRVIEPGSTHHIVTRVERAHDL